MKGDFPVFLGIAAALHIAVAFAIPAPDPGATTGGEGGESAFSIDHQNSTVAKMVEAWEAPPDLEAPEVQPAPAPPPPEPPLPVSRTDPAPRNSAPPPVAPATTEAAPQLETAPVLQPSPVWPAIDLAPRDLAAVQLPPAPELPNPTTRPERPRPIPPAAFAGAAVQTPEIDTANAEPLAPRTAPRRSIRPRAMPDRPAPPAAEAPRLQAQPGPADARKAEVTQSGQKGRTSAGTGGASQAGDARASGPRALSASQKVSLVNQWGAQIRSRIERRKRTPGGRGRVVLQITVAASGQLAGVSIARSSGNRRLDAAAVQAVRSAGRMPHAPAALGSGTFPFNLPVEFN